MGFWANVGKKSLSAGGKALKWSAIAGTTAVAATALFAGASAVRTKRTLKPSDEQDMDLDLLQRQIDANAMQQQDALVGPQAGRGPNEWRQRVMAGRGQQFIDPSNPRVDAEGAVGELGRS